MKKIMILAILSLVCLNSKAQESILPIDSVSKKITFSEVIHVDNVDSKELYNRAKQWIAFTYYSAKNVTQMDDKEAGTLIIKAMINVYTTFMVRAELGVVRYTLTIAVKDGKYKYDITDLWHSTDFNVNPRSNIITPGDLVIKKPNGGLMSMGQKNWNGIKIQTKESIENLISSLKEAMNKPSKQAENW